MRNKQRESAADRTAHLIMSVLGCESAYARVDGGVADQPVKRVGIVLGTGWSDVLMEKIGEDATCLPFEALPGFEDLNYFEEIEGHNRELVATTLQDCNKDVFVLRGRLHMNESHDFDKLAKMVRLQIEMLLQLGVKDLILTNAAGSLLPKVKVGDVVVHDGFITLFAPPLPLWGGEFVSPDDMLKTDNLQKAFSAARKAKLDCHIGSGAMVRGPFFEGRRHDKRLLRESGATMAMMSILPEVAVAALYPKTNVYAISFITNSDSEEHSHEENQARAKESSQKLGNLLTNLISSL